MLRFFFLLTSVYSLCFCNRKVDYFKKEIKKWPLESPDPLSFPLYKRLKFQRASISSIPKIEKIIHQIWLGGPVPKRFKKAIDSWKKIHPDWKYILWTDEDVQSFELENQKYFDEAENYGIKSDLFRMEILYRYGGLYVDCDQYCIKRHDIFHHCCELYLGNMISRNTDPEFANGLIGVKKGSNFLLKWIKGIPDSYKRVNKDPALKNNRFFYTLKFTGPFYLIDTVNRNLKGCLTFLALDEVFFNPVPLDPDLHWLSCSKTLELIRYKKYIKPSTYSVQFHTCSWGKIQSL